MSKSKGDAAGGATVLGVIGGLIGGPFGALAGAALGGLIGGENMLELGKEFANATPAKIESQCRDMARKIARENPEKASELFDKAEAAAIKRLSIEADKRQLSGRERDRFMEYETRSVQEKYKDLKRSNLPRRYW